MQQTKLLQQLPAHSSGAVQDIPDWIRQYVPAGPPDPSA